MDNKENIKNEEGPNVKKEEKKMEMNLVYMLLSLMKLILYAKQEVLLLQELE